MEQSSALDELITALSKAQGEFKSVPKSSRNPHLKNKYATLDDIIEAVRGPLAKNGLAYMQWLSAGPTLVTMLAHESGQWIRSAATIDTIPPNRGVNEMQAFGASLTYMKRYALSAMLGISSDEDMDGSTAKPTSKPKPKPKKSGPPKDLKDIQEADFMLSYEEAKDDYDMDGYIAYVGSLLTNAGYENRNHRLNLLKNLLGTTDVTEPTVGCWRLMEQYAMYLNKEDADKEYAKSVVKKGVENQVDWFGAVDEEIEL